jgi:hypothetical protein
MGWTNEVWMDFFCIDKKVLYYPVPIRDSSCSTFLQISLQTQVAHTLNILITSLQPFTTYHQAEITSASRFHPPFNSQGTPHPIALLELSLSRTLTSCYLQRLSDLLFQEDKPLLRCPVFAEDLPLQFQLPNSP